MLAALLVALLAACQTTPTGNVPGNVTHLPPGNSSRDGPEASPPPNLDAVPDAVPQIEPLRVGGPNKPYDVGGHTYVPLTDDRAVTEKGLASWYGKKFHGHRTASGETYNMYAMTAAHKTLPIPSYARVRNPANGHEVIVRVNDRGPFSPGRVIDLSYTAALKLGVLGGVQPVEISRITAEDIRTGAAFKHAPTLAAAPAAAQGAVVAQAAAPVAASATVTGVTTIAVGDLDRPATIRSHVVDASAAPADAVVAPAPDLGSAAATDIAPAQSGTVTTVTTETLAGPGSIPQTVSTPASAASPSLPVPAGVVLPPPAGPVSSPAEAVVVASTGSTNPSSTRPEPRDEHARADTTAGAGYWLQLGAYKQRDGALEFQRRLIDEQPWLAPLLAVFIDHGLNKLQAGPYTSRVDARNAAERIRLALQLVPTIVEKR